jgi:hypothetical protein
MNFFIYIGFSTATTAMKQTFMLHLFQYHHQRFAVNIQVGIVHDFDWA